MKKTKKTKSEKKEKNEKNEMRGGMDKGKWDWRG